MSSARPSSTTLNRSESRQPWPWPWAEGITYATSRGDVTSIFSYRPREVPSPPSLSQTLREFCQVLFFIYWGGGMVFFLMENPMDDFETLSQEFLLQTLPSLSKAAFSFFFQQMTQLSFPDSSVLHNDWSSMNQGNRDLLFWVHCQPRSQSPCWHLWVD